MFPPLPYSVLQGPLENDLVVHVALIAESQRYETQMGGVFLWEEESNLLAEINFIDPMTGFKGCLSEQQFSYV